MAEQYVTLSNGRRIPLAQYEAETAALVPYGGILDVASPPPPRRDTFGDTAAALASEPWQRARDLATGSRGQGWRGLGMLGLAGLSALEAGAAGAAGLAAEFVPQFTRRSDPRSHEMAVAQDLLAIGEALSPSIGRGANLLDDFIETSASAIPAIRGAAGAATADTVGMARAIARGDREMLSEVMQRGTEPRSVGATVPLWRGEVPSAAAERSIERAATAVPQIEGILPYLTAEEAATITPITARNLDAAFRATSVPDLIGASVAGAPKMGWYRQSGRATETIFGDDQRRFNTLLAATSPQTSVEANLQNAVNIWANWNKAGRPKDPDVILEIMGRSVMGDKGIDSVLPAWRNNAIRALSAPEGTAGADFRLSGPKVDSFGFAVSGDLDRFTNDAWQANLTGVPQQLYSRAGQNLPGYSAGYLGASAAGRKAAEQMSGILGETVYPSEVQETGWSFAKALYEQMAEGRPSGGPTAEEIYRQGLLSPSRISDVPDFATLFQDPTYGGPLREIGYGSSIDEAARAAAAIGTRDLSAAAEFGDAANVAGRLDDLYGHRQFVSNAAPFRTGAFNFTLPHGDGKGLQLPYGSGRSGYVPVGDSGASGRLIEPTPQFSRILNQTGASSPNFVQLKADTASRQEFIDRMSAARDTRGALGRSVDVYSTPRDYRGYKLFTTEDGKAGFGISPSGELSSVVSARDNPNRGFTDAALAAAVQNGAKWLMAFDTVLPQKYARFGFKPVARLPFSEDMARQDWGQEALDAFTEKAAAFNNGRPDAVFMVYDPNFSDTVANNVGGKITDDYDVAMREVQKAIAAVAKRN